MRCFSADGGGALRCALAPAATTRTPIAMAARQRRILRVLIDCAPNGGAATTDRWLGCSGAYDS